MSAIGAIAMANYTMMANNSAYNWMNAANARMSMISNMNPYNVSFGSLESLHAMDTQLELDMLTNSLQYKMAKAMLESLKKLQEDDAKRFSVFA